eukprot:SAG25_NODE_6000_length_597_cov_1.451807_2_plen_115_part_01
MAGRGSFWQPWPKGPTEMDNHVLSDTGLTAQDIEDIARAWSETMAAVHKALLAQGAYSWDLFHGMTNAGCCPQPAIQKHTCAQRLREECRDGVLGNPSALRYAYRTPQRHRFRER